MELIRRLRDELALTIMVVEHDMELVMGISDRVAVLHGAARSRRRAAGTSSTDAAVIEAYLGSEEDAARARARRPRRGLRQAARAGGGDAHA